MLPQQHSYFQPKTSGGQHNYTFRLKRQIRDLESGSINLNATQLQILDSVA